MADMANEMRCGLYATVCTVCVLETFWFLVCPWFYYPFHNLPSQFRPPAPTSSCLPLGLSSSPFIFTFNSLSGSSTPPLGFYSISSCLCCPLDPGRKTIIVMSSEPLIGMFWRCLTSHLLSHPAPSSAFSVLLNYLHHLAVLGHFVSPWQNTRGHWLYRNKGLFWLTVSEGSTLIRLPSCFGSVVTVPTVGAHGRWAPGEQRVCRVNTGCQ